MEATGVAEMAEVAGVFEMGRKGKGRPAKLEGEGQPVRLEPSLIEMAKLVGIDRGEAAGEVIVRLVRPAPRAEYRAALEKRYRGALGGLTIGFGEESGRGARGPNRGRQAAPGALGGGHAAVARSQGPRLVHQGGRNQQILEGKVLDLAAKGKTHKETTIRNRARMTAIPGSAAPGRQGGPAVASSSGPSS